MGNLIYLWVCSKYAEVSDYRSRILGHRQFKDGWSRGVFVTSDSRFILRRPFTDCSCQYVVQFVVKLCETISFGVYFGSYVWGISLLLYQRSFRHFTIIQSTSFASATLIQPFSFLRHICQPKMPSYDTFYLYRSEISQRHCLPAMQKCNTREKSWDIRIQKRFLRYARVRWVLIYASAACDDGDGCGIGGGGSSFVVFSAIIRWNPIPTPSMTARRIAQPMAPFRMARAPPRTAREPPYSNS